MPQLGQYFESFTSVFETAVTALVRTCGHSMLLQTTKSTAKVFCNLYFNKKRRCRFRVDAKADADGGCMIVETSNFVHNHPPAPEILADPSWRPSIRSAAARRALGLALESSLGGTGSKTGKEPRNGKKNKASRDSVDRSEAVIESEGESEDYEKAEVNKEGDDVGRRRLKEGKYEVRRFLFFFSFHPSTNPLPLSFRVRRRRSHDWTSPPLPSLRRRNLSPLTLRTLRRRAHSRFVRLSHHLDTASSFTSRSSE